MSTLTYLNKCLKHNAIFRWPERAFPLPVYIAPFNFYSINASERYNYQNMVTEAFRVWEQAGKGKFSFIMTNALTNSLINVEWRRVDRKSLGHCRYEPNERNPFELASAEVSIGISDGLIHNQYMDENEVFHTILHEIGHALGLQHSDDPGDIMYTPHQYGVVNISKRDIDTVNWLYRLPPGADIAYMNSTYKGAFSSMDDAIMKISRGENKSEFQRMLSGGKKEERNLIDENSKIAEIKKFQMAVQSIKLPKEITDKFKDM